MSTDIKINEFAIMGPAEIEKTIKILTEYQLTDYPVIRKIFTQSPRLPCTVIEWQEYAPTQLPLFKKFIMENIDVMATLMNNYSSAFNADFLLANLPKNFVFIFLQDIIAHCGKNISETKLITIYSNALYEMLNRTTDDDNLWNDICLLIFHGARLDENRLPVVGRPLMDYRFIIKYHPGNKIRMWAIKSSINIKYPDLIKENIPIFRKLLSNNEFSELCDHILTLNASSDVRETVLTNLTQNLLERVASLEETTETLRTELAHLQNNSILVDNE